jgi:hypothetical protein
MFQKAGWGFQFGLTKKFYPKKLKHVQKGYTSGRWLGV